MVPKDKRIAVSWRHTIVTTWTVKCVQIVVQIPVVGKTATVQWWPNLWHATTASAAFYSAKSKQHLLLMAALKSKCSAANTVADVSCSMKY